jgi:uncharacterized protein YlxW (UPF0749 family)
MSRYEELCELIEDAEERQRNAATEWEYESTLAELEELNAEREQLDNEVDSYTYEDELSSLRNAGF